MRRTRTHDVKSIFSFKFVSLLLKPQMFLDRRFSNEGQMKLTFRTRKTGLMANPQSRNKSRVACKMEVVVMRELLQDSERTSAMVTRWSMYGRIPTHMHPHETSRKTSAQPWGRLESSVTFRHNGQKSCERLLKNKNKQEQRLNHGPNS